MMSVIPPLPGYIFTEKLGKGSYATVYKAYRNVEKREVVAIKCVQKSSLTKSSVDNLITEIEILKKVKHENIVQLKDFEWNDTYIYLILEYCSGGDLSHFIKLKKRLSESVAQRFLQQLAKALQYLRSHNIAHMDLKPQNILLSSKSHPVLKLGDFGLAQYLHSSSEASSLRGSPLYMAPEILLKHQYDASVDLWSTGIILYECLFGQAPFSSQTFAELAEKIKSPNPIQIPHGAQISDKCRDLILCLLQRNPSKRLKFEEFFNHPFVDLEHMATEESYAKGVNLVKLAVSADSEGNFKEALQYYSEALDYLVPHLSIEQNDTRRREMRKKVFEYVSRAEELKKILKQACKAPIGSSKSSSSVKKNARSSLSKSSSSEKQDAPSNPSRAASSEKQDAPSSLSRTASSENQTSNLSELLEARPDLKKAIFLAKQADALVNDTCYEDACDIYQTALEIMIAVISEEPAGPNKELLYAEVNKWMEKAENLKQYVSVLKQQKRISRLNSVNNTVHFNTASENLDTTCRLQ